ncbi:phosphonate ABC transporter, permease protein PhnE [Rhodoplanes roseus]|uniref:Phosphonate ABC transporter, permease protein PhnE n=1 Tax=Rhodoplanes roseus TaxID=29409 RepID=A0A327L1S8_9BRAD|nr:phosphonate ABC transporter, permease protein PhnE [Rhodoplanes roseus]RAI44909.1 phosphonate ABC transporter, permease protein PhnE [Rhodoplanes roseus]
MTGPRWTTGVEAAAIRARYPAAFEGTRERIAAAAIVATMLALAGLAVWRLDVSFARLGTGLVQIAAIVGGMFPPTPGTHLAVFMHALGETLAIAFLGTLTGALIALPLGLLAAKTIVPNVFAHFAVRRVLDTIRGVDVLIWALIFINVVGLGPFAGILAIAASDTGSFGKLFSEAIENADRKPVDGVLSTGGSALHAIRWGLVPQVVPVIASQILYYFESNTRSATIIGIVGAGGIGLHLAEQIRVLEWGQVAFLVLLILVTVAIIDLVSSRLRFAIIGRSTVEVG